MTVACRLRLVGHDADAAKLDKALADYDDGSISFAEYAVAFWAGVRKLRRLG